MNHTWLQPVGGSLVHPHAKDTDGGPLIVDDGDRHYGRGRAFHKGMTRTERIASGFATPEDLIEHEKMRAGHLAWKESPEGKAWLAKNKL